MHKSSVTRHEMHEADIGSGEKSPSQKETEEMIRQVPARPAPLTMPPSVQTPPDVIDASAAPAH